MIISEIATCHNEDSLRMGVVFTFHETRYLTVQCSGEFLTKGRWCRLLLTPCRSTFAARHSYAGHPIWPQDLTSTAKFWQPRLSYLSQLWGCFCFFGPFFGLALEKISHGAWTGLVYGRQRERLLHFVHFDVGSVGLGENLRE